MSGSAEQAVSENSVVNTGNKIMQGGAR
jgi:hypothetical protein